jgi:methionyl-tRNA synthetase
MLLRYYLLRNVPSGSDGKASLEGFKKRHNNELANELGNLVNRAVKLSLKKISPQITASEHNLEFNISDIIVEDMVELMSQNLHHKALDKYWEGVSKLNTYLNDKEPWKIKDDPNLFGDIMYTCLHGVYVLGVMARAFMPEASQRILDYLGVDQTETLPSSFEKLDFNLSDPNALFMRMD